MEARKNGTLRESAAIDHFVRRMPGSYLFGWDSWDLVPYWLRQSLCVR